MSYGAGASPHVSLAWDLFATINSASHFHLGSSCIWSYSYCLWGVQIHREILHVSRCKALCRGPHGKGTTPNKNTHQFWCQASALQFSGKSCSQGRSPPALQASCALRNRMPASLTQVPPLNGLYWLRHLKHLLLRDLDQVTFLPSG